MKMNQKRLTLPVLLLAFGLVFAACSSDDAATGCDDVAVENAWVRLPAGENTALYFEVTNSGAAETAIVAASTEIAGTAELHETRAVEGQMQMSPVADQRVLVAAGETVSFEPGGLHVMMMGVSADLEDGQDVAFVIEFDGDCTLELDAPVRADTP